MLLASLLSLAPTLAGASAIIGVPSFACAHALACELRPCCCWHTYCWRLLLLAPLLFLASRLLQAPHCLLVAILLLPAYLPFLVPALAGASAIVSGPFFCRRPCHCLRCDLAVAGIPIITGTSSLYGASAIIGIPSFALLASCDLDVSRILALLCNLKMQNCSTVL